jgi:hypothetical protein
MRKIGSREERAKEGRNERMEKKKEGKQKRLGKGKNKGRWLQQPRGAEPPASLRGRWKGPHS